MSPWLAAGGPLLPGMLLGGVRVDAVDPHGYAYRIESYRDEFGERRVVHSYPSKDADLVDTDGATIGAMTQAVREAWGDPEAHLRLDLNSRATRWLWWSMGRWRALVIGDIEGATEVEAIAAAWAGRPK